MANVGFKGVDVRQTGTALVFDAFLQTSAGALVTSGTTNLYIWELQSDGTIKTYDFNNNTFSTAAVTTEAQAMTYRKSNNATTDTGFWTFALSTLTGFTAGAVYLFRVNNSGASPTDALRKFQFGGAEGDLAVTANGTGVAELNTDTRMFLGQAVVLDANNFPKVDTVDWGGTAVGGMPDSTIVHSGTCQAGSTASTIVLDSGANSTTNNSYVNDFVQTTGGTGAGQVGQILSYVASTRTATVYVAGPPVQGSQWLTTPDNTTTFQIIPFAVAAAALSLDSSGRVLLQPSQPGVTIPTVTTVTTTTNLTNLPSIPANWLTAAGINAGALNGKGDWLLASSYTAPPTTAAIATAVWTDTTGSDFATASSPGKILVTQLGGTFTTTSSSVFTVAALANGPSGSGSSPSAIATAVWQDLTSSSDFTMTGSIGKLLAGYVTPPTTSQIAAAILVTPANLLATDASGRVLLQPTQSFNNTGQTTNIPTAVQAILTTALTESATGNLANAFKTFFNVSVANGTINSLPSHLPATTGGLPILGTGVGSINVNGSGAVYAVTDSGVSIASHTDATTIESAITALGSPMQSGSSVALTSAGLDNVTVEAAAGGQSAINARQALALILDAAPAGIVTGAGTTTVTVKNPGATANRIVATVDTNGNRSAVTLTPPP